MDNLTVAQRSHTMRAVKSTGSRAELAVRRLCRDLGNPGYRLHRKDILGTPDLAYVGQRLAIFVHGCFWHGHSCKAGNKAVRTNADYWYAKIERNKARDAHTSAILAAAGWKVLVLWECEVKDERAKHRLVDFFKDS